LQENRRTRDFFQENKSACSPVLLSRLTGERENQRLLFRNTKSVVLRFSCFDDSEFG